MSRHLKFAICSAEEPVPETHPNTVSACSAAKTVLISKYSVNVSFGRQSGANRNGFLIKTDNWKDFGNCRTAKVP